MITEAVRNNVSLSHQEYIDNFPFETVHEKQYDVLKEICDSFNSGYKTIVLEAPTGFGKSPVAIAVARTLGSSYICSATKELQTQYVKDFAFLRAVKGMINFPCLVREDFIKNNNYACSKCGVLDESTGKKITHADECNHKVVQYGPCRSRQRGYEHDIKCKICMHGADVITTASKFHSGCRYRTYKEDYKIEFRNKHNERIEISDLRMEEYCASLRITKKNSDDFWMHTKNFADFENIRDIFVPCPYFDQLNKGLLASHSIFNYANF